jgi:antitoxin ParD1/3/4
MNISLTAPLEALVQEKVATGLYNNASEVVREALRLMHERDQREAAKLERLRTEVAKGLEQLDRGEYSTKSVAQIFDEVLVRHKMKK